MVRKNRAAPAPRRTAPAPRRHDTLAVERRKEMRATGLEPARVLPHGNLNPARLPIPPRPRNTEIVRNAWPEPIQPSAKSRIVWTWWCRDRSEAGFPMKKFSQQAASNIVPLIARILLFLAFVPTGWHHAMQQTVFTGDAAARLREIGVVSAYANAGPGTYVALPQEAPPIAAPAANMAGVQTRALHQLTLFFDSIRLPKPAIWAWAVTVFELIGGSLILIGLFTRLWTAGLVAWSLALFLATPTVADAFTAIWTPTDPASTLPRAMALSQLGLLVLALGLTLTGAGKLSLDGFIFRGRASDDGDEE